MNIHQFSPGAVSVDAELLDAFLDAQVDVIDGVVEGWNHYENSQDGESRASGRNSNN